METMKNDNMKEATLATLKLKDMLGIGAIGKSSEFASGSKKTLPNPATDSKTTTIKESAKKKKKPKVSNNGKSKKSKEHSHRQSKGLSASSSAQQSSKHNRTASKGGGVILNQSQMKENEKRGRKSKTTAGGAQSNNAEDGNYAWSAFQSPPDASTLPLPVFSSSSSHSPGKAVESEAQCQLKEEAEGQTSSLSTTASSANEPKKIEEVAKPQARNQKSVEALSSEDHIKAILNIEQKSALDTLDKTDVPSGNDQPVNSSGVNLAVLTSPPIPCPSNEKSSANNSSKQHLSFPAGTQTNHNERDPIAMLMNGQSYGTTNPTMASSPHYAHYPVPQQPHTNGYQHQPPMMQHHSHAPQYVTIQVQVPPVLLPGRQMMVSAVPGYPVAIVVPEGVHPGMIIPVTIPAHSPSPGQMGGPMSPVMMPHSGMMHLNIGSPPHQNFSHQEVRSGHQYSQPQFVPRQQQKRRNGPEPGSWAARAAAPPSNEVQQGKRVGNN